MTRVKPADFFFTAALAALAAEWLWSLAPLGLIRSFGYINSAEMRDVWDFNFIFIPQNWFWDPRDWCLFESGARLVVGFAAWCIALKLIERRFLPSES